MEVLCKKCGKNMPIEREEMGFSCCISCSPQSVYLGAPLITGKTGHDINLVRSDNKEAVRKAFNLGNCIIRRATPKNRRRK